MGQGSIQPYYKKLSLQAIEPVGLSFEKDLPSGRTVESAQAWLEKPDGTATAVAGSNVAVASPNVTVTVGPFTVKGLHALNVVATLSGATPVPKLNLRVELDVKYDDDGS